MPCRWYYVFSSCRYGASIIQSVVLRASIAASTGNYEKSDNILLNEKKRLEALDRDGNDEVLDKVCIVYVQTLIARQRFSDALSCLEDVNSLRYTASGVSATYYLKALHKQSQNPNQNTQEILSQVAVEYLMLVATALDDCSDSDYSSAGGTQTLLFISQVLELHQRHQASAEVLQILLRGGSDDLNTAERLTVTAHLVAALSYHNPSEAERYAASLPRIETGDFDATELETKDIPRLKKHSGSNGNGTDKDSTEGDARAQAIAARKVRKNLARRASRKAALLTKLEEQGKYDPARPTNPDPER